MIHWFEELGKEHNDMVGKKCANLGQMTRVGLAVPPGFALSIALYEKFIHETGTAEKMASYVKGLGNLQGVGISVFEEMSRTWSGPWIRIWPFPGASSGSGPARRRWRGRRRFQHRVILPS